MFDSGAQLGAIGAEHVGRDGRRQRYESTCDTLMLEIDIEFSFRRTCYYSLLRANWVRKKIPKCKVDL